MSNASTIVPPAQHAIPPELEPHIASHRNDIEPLGVRAGEIDRRLADLKDGETARRPAGTTAAADEGMQPLPLHVNADGAERPGNEKFGPSTRQLRTSERSDSGHNAARVAAVAPTPPRCVRMKAEIEAMEEDQLLAASHAEASATRVVELEEQLRQAKAEEAGVADVLHMTETLLARAAQRCADAVQQVFKAEVALDSVISEQKRRRTHSVTREDYAHTTLGYKRTPETDAAKEVLDAATATLEGLQVVRERRRQAEIATKIDAMKQTLERKRAKSREIMTEIAILRFPLVFATSTAELIESRRKELATV